MVDSYRQQLSSGYVHQLALQEQLSGQSGIEALQDPSGWQCLTTWSIPWVLSQTSPQFLFWQRFVSPPQSAFSQSSIVWKASWSSGLQHQDVHPAWHSFEVVLKKYLFSQGRRQHTPGSGLTRHLSVVGAATSGPHLAHMRGLPFLPGQHEDSPFSKSQPTLHSPSSPLHSPS